MCPILIFNITDRFNRLYLRYSEVLIIHLTQLLSKREQRNNLCRVIKHHLIYSQFNNFVYFSSERENSSHYLTRMLEGKFA